MKPSAARGDPADESSLLERDDELRALGNVVDAAKGGGGGFALINAPPGLGKSRLCAAVKSRALNDGMDVLEASAAPLDREFPFGVARKLFDRRVAQAGSGERERLLSGAASAASPLFEAASRSVGVREVLTVVYALYWLAVALSNSGPLLLLVDDAQWADGASLQFLLYLVARLESLPIGVVVATRDAEPDDETRLLDELRAAAGASLLSPANLSDGAVREMVHETLSEDAGDAFCAACATATAGNPFMVVELLRELKAEGMEPSEEAARRVAKLTPEIVLRSTLSRLAALPPSTAAVARAAAVLEEEAELRAVAALADLELREAAEAADILANVGILRPGDPLRFQHPLVVAGIADDIPAAERARLHAAAARLLHDDGKPAEHVVAHLMRGQRAGERWVVTTLRGAAKEASARGAPDAAAGWLRRALDEPVPLELRADVLAELGAAHAAAGDLDAACAVLSEAVGLARDPHTRAQQYLALGRILYTGGRAADAVEAFDRGIAELDNPAHELSRELRALIVSATWLDSSLATRGQEELEALLDDEREPTSADRAVLGQLALQEAFVAGGSAERARDLARRALGNRRWLRDPEGADMVTLALITGGLSVADAFEESVEVYTEVISAAQRSGSVMTLASACYARGGATYFAGRLDEARADLEQALAAGEGEWETFRVVARAYLGYVCLEQGDLDAAREALVDDVDAEAAGAQYISFADARGRLALAEGDAGLALAEHLRAGEVATAGFGEVNPGAFPWRSGAALAALRLGDRDQARELVSAELSIARDFGATRQLGIALRVSGVAEGGEAGLSLLREATDVLSDSPAPLEHARALTELGGALRRAGKRVEARACLRPAIQIADEFGAVPLREAAREKLHVAGARPRRVRLTGVDSLTASERRVASMAAKGLSNPEIAQALFVTRKAVEFHLGNVYSKLDIGSRKELPQALAVSADT